jgi:uncharacterized membrane protein
MSVESNETVRSRRLWIAAVILAILGVVDSAYLLWLKITGQVAACQGFGDCEAVNSSRYAELGGIPIALFGLLAYFLILVLFFIELKFPQWQDSLLLANFGVALAGTLYSFYLTYLELFVLKAVCPFCVVSAVIIILLFIISILRLYIAYSSEE